MKLQTLITQNAYQQIRREVLHHPREETGGVIIGFETPAAIVITDASGPGPCALHHPHSIQFDDKYCTRIVRKLLRRGKQYKYIGDWHSHPFAELIPSITDHKSFTLKAFTHYRTGNPVMIITGPPPLVALETFLLNGNMAKVSLELIDQQSMLQLKRKAI